MVTLEYPDGHYLSKNETLADADGAFELTGLMPGEALARVGIRYENPFGFRIVLFPVTIQDDSITTITLELPPANSRIEGTVTITGMEASHRTVWGNFSTPNGDEEHFTIVMPDGTYQLPYVPSGSGTLRLEVKDQDGNQFETSIAVEVGEAEVIRQDLNLIY